MSTIGDFASLLAALAVTGGVIVGLLQLSNFLQLRQMDTVLRMYSAFSEKGYQEDYWRVLSWKFQSYDELEQKGASEDYVAWLHVTILFEGMGLLLKRGLARIELLDDLLSGVIILVWEKQEPLVRGYRKKYNHPQALEWFEYLYVEMKKRLAKLGEPTQVPQHLAESESYPN